MFKGTNTILLNEATIILAIQEYLDRRVSDLNISPKVTSVNPRNDSHNMKTFEVVTEEKDENNST